MRTIEIKGYQVELQIGYRTIFFNFDGFSAAQYFIKTALTSYAPADEESTNELEVIIRPIYEKTQDRPVSESENW